jgi:hypothetical protein
MSWILERRIGGMCELLHTRANNVAPTINAGDFAQIHPAELVTRFRSKQPQELAN